jgi:beta-glucosidase
MGVAFVTGLQGDDPKYYRVIATPKHFAVHSGPEPTRHGVDVTVSKHDMEDTYLPAFRATIVEGKAGSIMCAYNRVNGQPACASDFLLVDRLRDKWKFNGYVVSDCDAVYDMFHFHKYTKNMAEAAGLSVKKGMDNDCADYLRVMRDNSDYVRFIDAVKQGFLTEKDIDISLRRTFAARFRLACSILPRW